MFKKLQEVSFKFHTLGNGFITTEAAMIGLLSVHELQFASFFAQPVQGSTFDSPIISLISLTNVFAVIGTSLNLVKLLLIALTVFYALSLGVDLIGIGDLIRKNRSKSTLLQNLSSTLFTLQKYLLLIPALTACSSTLGSVYPILKILGGVLFGLICIYNLSNSMFKISLPYSKAPFANISSEEETLEFAVTVLAAFISSNYVKTFPIATGYELSLTGTVSLRLSIPFLVLSLLRIIKLMILLPPSLKDRKYQKIHVIFSFSSFYALIELILSGRGVASKFPTLVIISLLIKVTLNCREVLLTQLFNTLQSLSKRQSVFFQLVAIRSLHSYFESTRDQHGDLIKIIQLLLTDPSNKEIFLPDQNEPTEVTESRIKSQLRPQLTKFIENYHSLLIRVVDPRVSFSVRVAYIQFLSEISDNKSKAIQHLFEAKQVLRGRISLKQQLIFKIIKNKLMADSRNKFHLREVLDIQRSHQDCVVKTQELVSIRTEMLSRLLAPNCDLDILTKLSIDFTDKGKKLIKDLKRNLNSNCNHIETVALFDYVQLCLYEMSLGSRTLKLEAALSRVKVFDFNDLDEEANQIPEKDILMHIDSKSRLCYTAFSLNSTKLGEGVVWSKNFRALLGLPDHIMASEMKIENIFPSYFKEKARSLLTEASANGATFENSRWKTSLLQKFDGSLIEIKVLMSIEVLQNQEVALVLYTYFVPNSLNKFLFDEALRLIGFTDSLLQSIAAATKTSETEATSILLEFSSLRQFLPTFDPTVINRDNCVDYEYEFQLESPEPKSQDQIRKHRSKKKQVLFLNGTISKSHLFDSELFTLTINQISKRSRRPIIVTTLKSPLLAMSKIKSDNTLPSPLEIPLSQQNLPESTPIDNFSTTKPQDEAASKESDAGSDLDDKINQIFRKTRQEDSERSAALQDIEPAASSQLSSSLLTNRRKKIKQLVANLDVPRFLVGINILGHLSVLGLVVMTIVTYVILSQAFYQFSQFAQVAPFPSYLNAVVKSVYTNTEQIILVNNNFCSPSIGAYLQSSAPKSFSNKVQQFLTTFNQFMVDYDVPGLSPHFQYNDFEISVSRQGIFDTPQNVSIYEASTIFLGVIYKINKTALSKLNSNESEVAWMEQYLFSYFNIYENMRLTLYSDFNLRYKSILSLFDIILVIGTIVVLVIVASLAVVLKATERRKSQLMRQVLTIPRSLIEDYILVFQTEYKTFFGTDITGKGFQLPSQTKAKKNHKKDTRHSSNTLYKRKEAGIFVILLVSLISIVYVMAYYVIANIYFKHKTREAIPYIDNIDLQSRCQSYSSMPVGVFMQLANEYNTSIGRALVPTVNEWINRYKEFRDDVDTLMSTVQSTLLATDYASDQLIQRYTYNLSTIHICDDIITNSNYQICLTAFNDAAQNGYGGMVNSHYDYSASIEETFFANPTVATLLQIYSSNQVKYRNAFGVALDSVITDNIKIEGANLAWIMQRFQQSLNVLLIIGILQMASLLFLIWRPINRRMAVGYLNCRRIYAVLPIYLISDNKHILKVLKLQRGSQFC